MGMFVVTGGATGIGAAVKRQLINEGHSVFVVDVKGSDIQVDLSTESGRSEAREAIREWAPSGLDGLIPCAGLGPHFEQTEKIVEVNYFGVLGVLFGIDDLLEERQGSVVFISSNTAALVTDQKITTLLMSGNEAAASRCAGDMDGQTVYVATKYAIANWMRSNVADFAARGIRLNAVAPGFTKTPLTDKGREDPEYGPMIEKFIKTIPVGFEGKPDDIATAVCFLLRREASYICGSVLFVDGGHDAVIRPDRF